MQCSKSSVVVNYFHANFVHVEGCTAKYIPAVRYVNSQTYLTTISQKIVGQLRKLSQYQRQRL